MQLIGREQRPTNVIPGFNGPIALVCGEKTRAYFPPFSSAMNFQSDAKEYEVLSARCSARERDGPGPALNTARAAKKYAMPRLTWEATASAGRRGALFTAAQRQNGHKLQAAHQIDECVYVYYISDTYTQKQH